MTFLGIGPGELFLIFIIALVVVGPERLPGFARQLGKAVVGLRNWVQHSPDAQMLLRARDELELELRTIRQDLTQEMETVRTEMMSVREEMLQATREATADAARALDEAEQAAQVALDAQEAVQVVEETVDHLAEHTIHTALEEQPASLSEALSDAASSPETAPLSELQRTLNSLAPEQVATPRTIAPPEIYTPASDDSLNNGQTVARSLKPGQAAAQRRQEEAQLADKQALQSLQAEVEQLKQQVQELLAAMHTLQTKQGSEE